MSDVPMPICVDVEQRWMRQAVLWVCRRVHYTVDRTGMNKRSLPERIDDGVMGEVGSIAFMQVMDAAGRGVVAYDQVRTDYKQEDPGWDVATSESKLRLSRWADSPKNPRRVPQWAESFSIKASRIPEADSDVREAIQKRDFKIRKLSQNIDKDLAADYIVQIYFDRERTWYDGNFDVDARVVNQVIDEKEKAREQAIDRIIDSLELDDRFGECHLAAWNFRERVISHVRALEEIGRSTTWTSYHQGSAKKMWIAPLCDGGSFQGLS